MDDHIHNVSYILGKKWNYKQNKLIFRSRSPALLVITNY